MNRRHLLAFAAASAGLGISPAVHAQTQPAAKGGIDYTSAVIGAFESLGSDLRSIEEDARGYSSVYRWRLFSNGKVGVFGGVACAIPMSGLVTLPADFVYVMSKIYDSAMGVGFVLKQPANKADFANILAVWTDELALDDATLKAAFDYAERLTAELGEEAVQRGFTWAMEELARRNPAPGLPVAPSVGRAAGAAGAGTKEASGYVASNALAHKGGAKVTGKLSTKVAAKAGGKIAAKYGAKVITAPMPVLSSAVCGGVNVLIMNSILKSAEQYFTALGNYRKRRYGVAARPVK